MAGLTPEERPDPLAPPAGYGVRPEDAVKPDLSTCSMTMGSSEQHCALPVAMIVWTGCTQGEHAGPSPFCHVHGRMVAGMPSRTCGTCEESGLGRNVPIKIFRVEYLENCPPPDLPPQHALSGIFGSEGDDTDGENQDH